MLHYSIGGAEMKREQKTINFPIDVIGRIKNYQKEKYLGSFTTAVIQLIIKQLEVYENE